MQEIARHYGSGDDQRGPHTAYVALNLSLNAAVLQVCQCENEAHTAPSHFQHVDMGSANVHRVICMGAARCNVSPAS